MAKKYRKKPLVIEAVKVTEDNMDEVASFVGLSNHERTDYLNLFQGAYMIKGIKGEFYPCSAEVFALTYEEVEE